LAVTMKDVAKRAGVAVITVSRVITGTSYVHGATREKVHAAIEELQYVPNRMASSLRSHQTNTLALLLPTITQSFWTTIARGVEDEAESRGYSVFFCNTDDDPAKEARYIEVLLRYQVDGLALVPTAESGPQLQRLLQRQMTFVQLHRKVTGIEADVVRADSYGGATVLTRQLLDAGLRQIAYVGGPLTTFTGSERLAGYKATLMAADVAIDPAFIKIGLYSQQTGYRLVRELLQADRRPEALFIANAQLAIGALHALMEAGLRLSHDITVASYYDEQAREDYSPFLTTAIQPTYEIGRLGIRRLLDRIAGKQMTVEDHILPNRIMIRTDGHVPGQSAFQHTTAL